MEEQRQEIAIAPGIPMPLGGSVSGRYYNFAVTLSDASECKLCIFVKNEKKATVTLSLFEHTDYPGVFSGRIEKKKLDALGEWSYLYEAHGRQFVDPYCKCVCGRENFGKDEPLYSRISKESFSWGADTNPGLPFRDVILYKLHVRGFTMKAPGVKHPGTYRGLMEKSEYLVRLGVNAILLYPVNEFDELIRTNSYVPLYAKQEETPRINYWGYAKDNLYFVPKTSYAADTSHACREMKQMVKHFHSLGIEVWLEFNFLPTTNPYLIVECLSFWATEYHIDGFRVNKDCVPEKLLALHPYLQGVKIVTAGFDTNAIFPDGKGMDRIHIAECNAGFSEDVRQYLKGDENMVGRVEHRLVEQNPAQGIIHYITDNNGFTLNDLYSYDVKHNEENMEENRDGADINYSWNCGVEGPTNKKKIRALRLKMKKNAMALLLLSQGTPMILAGDEFGNSQNGNNNSYCQDNETGWVSWNALRSNTELFEFTRMLIALRREHPVFHNPNLFKGMDYISCGCPDISGHGVRAWYPDTSYFSRTLAVMLCGNYAVKGRNETDSSFYIACNMHWEPHTFDLPAPGNGEELELLFSTDRENTKTENKKQCEVPARSLVVFMGKKPEKKKYKMKKEISPDAAE